MKKTLVTFIITLLILMVCVTTVQALSFGVKITPSSSEVNKGESVTLVVAVNNLDVGANGLNTFLTTIQYDKTVFNTLTADDIKSLNGWDSPTFNPDNGMILTAKGSFVNTESDVLEITLTAKQTAPTGSTTVTFKDIEASNSQTDISAGNASYLLNITDKTTGGDDTPDTTKPNITVKYEDVSNGVKVTLISDKPLKAVAGWTLSADKMQLSRVYTTSYNGTMVVEDEDGNKSDSVTINVVIDNGNDTTDTTKPTGTVKYSKDTTGKVTATVTASEEVQPVTGWTLSADKKVLTRVFTENYTGTITLTDLAGNKSDPIEIKVDISTQNGGADTGNNNNNNSGTATDKLPQAGLETYIIPAIAVVAIIGTIAYVRYKSMEY